MVINFNEEAIALAKDIINCWDQERDFQQIVSILQDYITDLDSNYKDLIK
jgi:hypothetical protein